MPIPGAVRILNDAPSQADRVADAPDPAALLIDGRGLADLLAFVGRYAALITFWNLGDQPNGTWAPFFSDDPAIAQAMHATLDLDLAEAELRRSVERLRGGEGDAAAIVGGLVTTVARLVAIHDRADLPAGHGPELLERARARPPGDALSEPLDRYHHHIGTRRDGASGDDAGGPVAQVARGGETAALLVDLLEDLAVTVLAELRRGQDDARAALAAALAGDAHAPHAALFIAFASLFLEAGRALNDIPRRLVDFYYRDVLRQETLAAEPDRVFLTFTLADPARPASVPRGALFVAGTDFDGAAIGYAADAALEVRPTRVVGLSVHRLTDTPAAGPGPTGVLSGEVAFDADKPGSFEPFPMFGSPEIGTFGPLRMADATMAFTVVSPTLMLQGGRRHVAIGLLIAPAATPPASGAAAPGDATADDERRMMVDWVARLIGEGFEFFFSTAGGWVMVERLGVTPQIQPGDGGTLYTLAFDLPADAPPLVAVATPADPDAPAPTLDAAAFPKLSDEPAMVARLRSGDDTVAAWSRVRQFAIVSKLAVSEIRIDVAVEDLTALTIGTRTGGADLAHDFAPFGVPARRDAALTIAAPELFAKTPAALAVAIDWSGLPVTSTGFTGYYQGYVLDADGRLADAPLFDNAAFRVVLSVDNPGSWTVDDDPLPLFATVGDAGRPALAGALARRTTLEASVQPAAAVPPYYNPAASALRVRLVAPSYAFGDVLYASNLHRAAQGRAAPAGLAAGLATEGSAARVAALAEVNATAPARRHPRRVAAAAERAVVSLSDEAAAALREAVGLGLALPGDRGAMLDDLEAVIADVAASGTPSIWQRLLRRPGALDLDAMPAALEGWAAAHADALGPAAEDALGRARGLLATARAIAAAHLAAAGEDVDRARSTIAAALDTHRAPTVLPNVPWVPMAARVAVSYRASTVVAIGAVADADGDAAASGDGAPRSRFLHVAPFNKLRAPRPGETVSLLPAVDPHPALFIELAEPGRQVSLLFVLAAGAQGWWSDPPQLVWEQHGDGRWSPITVLEDGTGGLTDSGIVVLALDAAGHGKRAIRLRIRALDPVYRAPLVLSVVANALCATWVGPGGAATRGTPLPAGTIAKSATPLANIGGVLQPMQSLGGRPPAIGAAFQRWIAERLRHKGFAVDAWDYARLVLEEVPSLWQAAVIAATDETTGEERPGHVWLVVVAGPDTPNVRDPAVPMVGRGTLAAVGALIRKSIGPFVEFAVTNPPYLRLAVSVTCVFTADDSPEHWEGRLDADLRRWLSPWPMPDLPSRPRDYYTRHAIIDFVRTRPYVEAILTLDVAPDPAALPAGHHYLTSAPTHAVKGRHRHAPPVSAATAAA